MQTRRISLKLYAEPQPRVDHAELVRVFHGWIKAGALAGEMLVDVADYGHVHEGPAVLLVGHASDYALDLGEGRQGLWYQRKRAPEPGPRGVLEDGLHRLLRAAVLLEAEPKLGFKARTDEVLLRALDRLRAPNLPVTWEADRAEIEAAAARLFGEGASAAYEGGADPRGPFTARLRARGAAPLSVLAARLSDR